MLAAHTEKLQRRLATVQMDRENLRFQVRLLQQSHHDDQPERLRERLRHLEVENRSAEAVEGEHSQLKARLAEVERELESLEGRPPTAASVTGSSSASGPSRAPTDVTSEETLDELRWENRLLQKRLLRLQRFSEDLQQDALRARLKSACRSRGEEPMRASRNSEAASYSAGSSSGAALEELVAGNEKMLLQLRCEVRETATALARGQREQVSLTGRRPAGADEEGVVDVLTLSDLAVGSDDVEWHERC